MALKRKLYNKPFLVEIDALVVVLVLVVVQLSLLQLVAVLVVVVVVVVLHREIIQVRPSVVNGYDNHSKTYVAQNVFRKLDLRIRLAYHVILDDHCSLSRFCICINVQCVKFFFNSCTQF